MPFADYGRNELTDLSYPVGDLMFQALFETLGAEAFDRAYRNFFQQHRAAGGTAADLIAAFHAENPASDRIFREWYRTTAWFSRLGGGESLKEILRGYPH